MNNKTPIFHLVALNQFQKHASIISYFKGPHGCLQVLCMSAEEFREFKDRNGWEDDKSEDSLTITDIPKLKASWRQLLRDSVLLTLQTYATDLKTEQDLLSNKEVYAALSWREQQALQVRYGQKMILHRLLELTRQQAPFCLKEYPEEELRAKLVCTDAWKEVKFGSFALCFVPIPKGKVAKLLTKQDELQGKSDRLKDQEQQTCELLLLLTLINFVTVLL